jgi:hypothetical protein
MPHNDNPSDNKNETAGVMIRNGHPVIKTTIELDKELYIRMKEEIARSHSSIRDFVSKAAIEKLTKSTPAPKADTELDQKELLNNHFAIKLLAILELEVPHPFNIALLLTKLIKNGIAPQDFSAAYLSDSFIKELVRPVDFLSGPDAAVEMTDAILRLRGE